MYTPASRFLPDCQNIMVYPAIFYEEEGKIAVIFPKYYRGRYLQRCNLNSCPEISFMTETINFMEGD